MIENFPVLEDASTFINYGGLGVTLITLVTFLIICHVILPYGKRPLVDLLPGIGLTLMLWIVGGVMVAEYFENYSAYSSIYGGLAGIMSALLFLYLNAFAFILGGEFNAARIRHKKGSKFRRG